MFTITRKYLGNIMNQSIKFCGNIKQFHNLNPIHFRKLLCCIYSICSFKIICPFSSACTFSFMNGVVSWSSRELLKHFVLITFGFIRSCLFTCYLTADIWWNILIMVKPWSRGPLILNFHAVNCSEGNSF